MRNRCYTQLNGGVKDFAAGIISDKIVLTSKSRSEKPVQPRKPVKGCYCISEGSETKEWKTPSDEPFLSRNIGEDREIVEIYSSPNTLTARNSLLSSLLGYETLRRAGNITYLPSSEFLRRVQKKVSYHRKKKSMTVRTELNSSSDDSRTCCTSNSGKKKFATEPSDEKIMGRSEKIKCGCNYEIIPTEAENRGRRRNVERSKSSRSHSPAKRASTKNRENENIQRNNELKGKPKVSSKKIVRSVDRGRENRAKSQRIVRTISAHSRCCNQKKPLEKTKVTADKNVKTNAGKVVNDARGHCDCETEQRADKNGINVWQLSRDRIHPKMRDNDDRIRELNNFRKDNYFETHGSIDTLVGSSRSSVSTIENYELNDRIFAMPRCTRQIKRIHYYPSYVVREERDHTSCRKKIRSRRGEFTGHVIDLGILKIPCNFSTNIDFDH